MRFVGWEQIRRKIAFRLPGFSTDKQRNRRTTAHRDLAVRSVDLRDSLRVRRIAASVLFDDELDIDVSGNHTRHS
jgi:hypothetical protein